MTPLCVLILEDNKDFIQSLSRAFRGRLNLIPATTVETAKERLDSNIDLVLVDIFIGEQPKGLDFLRWIAEERADLPVLVITGQGTIDLAVQAMRLGAEDFIDKGRLNLQEIEQRIHNTLERRRLRRQKVELEQRLEVYEPRTLIGDSRVMQDLLRYIKTVAEDGEVTVLLRGESGTGKELAARLIHSWGKHRNGPFVGVDLSTLPRETFPSELFGYERGAFTGAHTPHPGYIEEAHHGVLFLDEIGELPKDLQSRLLRVLEERTITRLGSTRPKSVDIQLVTATNQDLEKLVAKGAFRTELYHRLRVFEILLPALREHPDDIAQLVTHFLSQWRAAGRTPLRIITPEALEILKQYPWPGNVRELRNVLERASVQAKADKSTELRPTLLPLEVRNVLNSVPTVPPLNELNVERVRAHAELACAAKALARTSMHKEKARELLGYGDRHTMRRRLGDLREQFRDIWNLYPELERYYESGTRERHI